MEGHYAFAPLESHAGGGGWGVRVYALSIFARNCGLKLGILKTLNFIKKVV